MTVLPADLTFHQLGGPSRTAREMVSMFHLVAVVVDPYTHESSWILDTAGRILENFRGADCRAAFIVAADEAGARQFLGPWADELLVIFDPDREVIAALEVERLPAFVHVELDRSVVGKADGWEPDDWRKISENLAEVLAWIRPEIPQAGDPVPYAGTPAA